jgi:hypothetical protein
METPTTNPLPPVQNKKSMRPLAAMLLLALLVAGLGYFVPIAPHLVADQPVRVVEWNFCDTQPFGFPLKIQDKLITESLEVIGPDGQIQNDECVPQEDNLGSNINWLNWILNFVIFTAVFVGIGFLAIRTRWFWYLLIPIVIFISLLIGKSIEANQTHILM